MNKITTSGYFATPDLPPPCPSCERLRVENLELKRKYGFTYCAYCGESFAVDAPNSQDAITKHIANCKKHPMRQLDKLKAENAELKAKLDKVQDKYLCQICGAKTVMIRGKHPRMAGAEKREVCPTCLAERMDQIKDISDRDYGKAWQAKSALNQPKGEGRDK